MNHTIGIIMMALLATSVAQTQSKQKKTQHFVISKTFPFTAEKVWSVVGEDYGAIAHSHPAILHSEYVNGNLQAGEGAERVCYFNEKKTQFLKEKMVDYDSVNK